MFYFIVNIIMIIMSLGTLCGIDAAEVTFQVIRFYTFSKVASHIPSGYKKMNEVAEKFSRREKDDSVIYSDICDNFHDWNS